MDVKQRRVKLNDEDSSLAELNRVTVVLEDCYAHHTHQLLLPLHGGLKQKVLLRAPKRSTLAIR